MKAVDAQGKMKNAELKCKRRKRRFTPVTRQLCLQHHARGFGYKRISKATGIPISTIKYHVRKERDGANEASPAPLNGASGAAVVHAPAALPVALLTKGSALSSPNQTARFGFEKSIALVEMMHAVHDVMHRNVYAFARAMQFDSHGAPGLMNAADTHMLTLALNLLLQDPWAERQELASLAQMLLLRLCRARDFLRSAISLSQNATSSPATLTAAVNRDSGGSSSILKTKYWECPVCSKRLVHTGKSAHLARCMKKCKVVLTHEQLQAAKATAVAAVAQSESSPEELKHQLTLKIDSNKCHQVRYMQLVVAVNTSLQQDVETAPAAILESPRMWRAVQSGPNPVVAALALVSLALQSHSHERKKRALVSKYAYELADKVAEQIVAVEMFLARCVVDALSPTATAVDDRERADQRQDECDEPHRRTITCTCHRVRISALIHS